MKLVILTEYPKNNDTLLPYSYLLLKHLRLEKDITEITLLTNKPISSKELNFKNEGCKITVKPILNLNYFWDIYRIRNVILQIAPDLVLINYQFLHSAARIKASIYTVLPTLLKTKKIAVVSLLHNILEEELNDDKKYSLFNIQKNLNFVFTKLLLFSDLIAVTKQSHLSVLEEKYKARNAAVIPYDAFQKMVPPNFNIPRGSRKILAFGKFDPSYNLDILIESVEFLRERTNENIEIIIAGEDSKQTPGYLSKIKQQYFHTPQVHFIEHIASQDVSKLFEQCSIVVFSNTIKTSILKEVHLAGSYGKAMVMPYHNIYNSIIKKRKFMAEFYSPKNVESLGNAIHVILAHDKYQKFLGKANYKAAYSLSMYNITEKYMAFFKAILFQNSNKTAMDAILQKYLSKSTQKLNSNSG